VYEVPFGFNPSAPAAAAAVQADAVKMAPVDLGRVFVDELKVAEIVGAETPVAAQAKTPDSTDAKDAKEPAKEPAKASPPSKL